MNNFVTIRRAAKIVGVPEFKLRKMVKNKECPGFYSGNRFLVNLRLLQELLDQMSQSHKQEDNTP